jgi:hypothetical protein
MDFFFLILNPSGGSARFFPHFGLSFPHFGHPAGVCVWLLLRWSQQAPPAGLRLFSTEFISSETKNLVFV